MHANWLVLLPTCIVLISTFITGSLNISLLIGIITGALIATNFSLVAAITIMKNRLIDNITDWDYIYLYIFLFVISIIITLLNHTGGSLAFAHTLTKKLRSARMAESTSLLISLMLFIDDYLSSLTVGYVMRPITDNLTVPRVKLAYLVRAMTGPLVILAPISSWVGILTVSLDTAGISSTQTPGVKIVADPFFIYLQTLPFMFYSLLVIASTWFIVQCRISFGPMHTQEEIAKETHNLFGGKNPLVSNVPSEASSQGTPLDLIFPLCTLIFSVFAGCLWNGGYWLFGGPHTLLDAFKNSNMFPVLCFASIVTLLITTTFSLIRHTITPINVIRCIKEGIELMLSAVIMVILAAMLSSLLRSDLATGTYLANLLQGVLYLPLLPLIFFIIAAISATLLGVALGTIMILMPIAIAMLTTLSAVTLPTTPDALAYLLPVIAAIFWNILLNRNGRLN